MRQRRARGHGLGRVRLAQPGPRAHRSADETPQAGAPLWCRLDFSKSHATGAGKYWLARGQSHSLNQYPLVMLHCSSLDATQDTAPVHQQRTGAPPIQSWRLQQANSFRACAAAACSPCAARRRPQLPRRPRAPSHSPAARGAAVPHLKRRHVAGLRCLVLMQAHWLSPWRTRGAGGWRTAGAAWGLWR